MMGEAQDVAANKRAKKKNRVEPNWSVREKARTQGGENGAKVCGCVARSS